MPSNDTAPRPQPDELWFSYDPLEYFVFHRSEEAARLACEQSVADHMDSAGDPDQGWDENAEDVCWGKVIQSLTQTSVREFDPDKDHKGFKGRQIVTMELRPAIAPATPSAEFVAGFEAAKKQALQAIRDNWEQHDATSQADLEQAIDELTPGVQSNG